MCVVPPWRRVGSEERAHAEQSQLRAEWEAQLASLKETNERERQSIKSVYDAQVHEVMVMPPRQSVMSSVAIR